MDTNFYLIAVGILATIALMDLIVGVSNDAVNFLNSSFGARVASRRTILFVASLGILAGVFFSSGMMEVARKGIFHPQFFTMPELLTLFLGVMIADILILDLFNTYGLPTSTTVSIVFELLGAAVALSVLKIIDSGDSLLTLEQYINTAKALTIIGGILLSVVVAFSFGALVQFFGRLLFSFDYESYLPRYGGLWGGLSFGAILLFILIKGAKGASFIPTDVASYIKANIFLLFFASFIVSALFFQLLTSLFRLNVLKPIVLIGTFSLALAFAANDLVNFIGVPLAGFHSYSLALSTSDPAGALMSGLAGKVPSSTMLLLLCGIVMTLALWFSKKARTVTETEVGLSSHDEENEQFESIALSRVIVRLLSSFFDTVLVIVPRSVKRAVKRRYSRNAIQQRAETEAVPAFDLLRASTNLMVASVVVSFATSLKLPLSTTYVTFMVAMGTSFADQAWGRETAVYRVTGVLTVIGGWFITAFGAFSTAALFCTIIYFGQAFGVVALLVFALVMLWRTHNAHKRNAKLNREREVFNLKKISNAPKAVATTFQQTALLIRHIRTGLEGSLLALDKENRLESKAHYRLRKQVMLWSQIISANVFKAMRLLQYEQISEAHEYPRTITCLQALSESYRDTVRRSYSHLSENHKRMLSVQMKELSQAQSHLSRILEQLELHLSNVERQDVQSFKSEHEALQELISGFAKLQNERIHNRSSKTRLSILYFAITGNMLRISRQSLRLYEIFEGSLVFDEVKHQKFDKPATEA